VSGTSVEQINTYAPATRHLSTSYTGTEHPGTPGTFDEIATNSYGYDNAGDITSVDETTGSAVNADQCFSYDYAQRLTQAWTTTATTCQTTPTQGIVGGTDPYWQTYTYDLDSDRTSKTDHAAAGDTTHTYNYPTATSNQPHAVTTVTTGSNTDTYIEDASGNVTSRTIAGTGQTRTYDAEDHLATVVQGSATTSYVYDTSGRRLLSHNADGTTTAYFGNDEVTQTGTVLTGTRYYAGFAVRTAAAGLTWTIADPHGTGDTAVNAATLAVTRRRLDPFGNPRNTTETWPTNKGFLNDTQDPTGTNHIGAREYDSSLGRFTSLDPALEAGSPQQLNGYSYAADNPVTDSDPTGQKAIDSGDEYFADALFDDTGLRMAVPSSVPPKTGNLTDPLNFGNANDLDVDGPKYSNGLNLPGFEQTQEANYNEFDIMNTINSFFKSDRSSGNFAVGVGVADIDGQTSVVVMSSADIPPKLVSRLTSMGAWVIRTRISALESSDRLDTHWESAGLNWIQQMKKANRSVSFSSLFGSIKGGSCSVLCALRATLIARGTSGTDNQNVDFQSKETAGLDATIGFDADGTVTSSDISPQQENEHTLFPSITRTFAGGQVILDPAGEDTPPGEA
jgi:RHS repeat-associated protein